MLCFVYLNEILAVRSPNDDVFKATGLENAGKSTETLQAAVLHLPIWGRCSVKVNLNLNDCHGL